jgi:hypothetical protein
LFLITLPITTKSQEIFKLTGLCHIAIKVEAYKAQTGLTAKSSVMSGLTAGNPPVACGAGAATYTRSARKKRMLHLHHHAATASWRREKLHTRQTIGVAATRRMSYAKGRRREHPNLQQDGCSLPATPHRVCPTQRH